MGYKGYREDELVSNRSALLLFGGTPSERRAWAEEAQAQFQTEGELVVVDAVAQLTQALAHARGVVHIADLGSLGLEGQAAIVRCLLEKEERPKLVLGLGISLGAALEQGKLRDDLAYRLQQAQVNLSTPGLKDAIRERRQKQEQLDARNKVRPAAPAGRAKKPLRP